MKWLLDALQVVAPALAVLAIAIVPLLMYSVDVKVARMGCNRWRCWIRSLEDMPLVAPFQVTIAPSGRADGHCCIEIRSPWDLDGAWTDDGRTFELRGRVLEAGEVWMIDVVASGASDVAVTFHPRGRAEGDPFLQSLFVPRVAASGSGLEDSTPLTYLPGNWPIFLTTFAALCVFAAPFVIPGAPCGEYFDAFTSRDWRLVGGIFGVACIFWVCGRRPTPPRILDVRDYQAREHVYRRNSRPRARLVAATESAPATQTDDP
jgi:hypothetical protein